MMEDSLSQFYDELADEYHLIFADWKKGITWQGETLDKLIRSRADGPALSVLDCTCGIGTQAIGLAARGYRVHGTDLSAASIERAKKEADAFGVSIAFGVADIRRLAEQVEGAFDVVLSCDNALPHLSSDEELLAAVSNMKEKLRPGGLFLASIRDYDAVADEKPRSTLPSVIDDSEGKRISFQVWDWDDDGNSYRFHQFIISENRGEWSMARHSARYRVLLRADLDRILNKAGFSDVRWHLPDESGYYQPIVTAFNR